MPNLSKKPPARAKKPPVKLEPRCASCLKPQVICVCDRSAIQSSRIKVLILQHPQEQALDVSSALVTVLNLQEARLVAGLSWPSLPAAWGAGGRALDSKRWAVLTPAKAGAPAVAGRYALVDKRGKTVQRSQIDGVIVLDGTWSQAKTLWWRNPWLLKLTKLNLFPKQPSVYGKLRKEPRGVYLSTMEAVGEALFVLGEGEEVRDHMLRVCRTMVQRVRDARAEHGGPIA